MSDYEQHIGKVRMLKQNPDEQYYSELLTENGVTKEEFYDSFEEAVRSDLHEKYLVTKDAVFEIIENEELDGCDDIYFAKQTGDNEFTYVVRFYNGGCPFSEAVEQALTDLNKAA